MDEEAELVDQPEPHQRRGGGWPTDVHSNPGCALSRATYCAASSRTSRTVPLDLLECPLPHQEMRGSTARRGWPHLGSRRTVDRKLGVGSGTDLPGIRIQLPESVRPRDVVGDDPDEIDADQHGRSRLEYDQCDLQDHERSEEREDEEESCERAAESKEGGIPQLVV